MNKTILIIEDDPDVRLGYQMRLNANHYDLLFASDGYTSMVEAQKKPDLIILDLGLPAGDGFSVLERLQAIPHLAVIPVIVVSAREPHANKARALQAGAKAFLQKPANNDELLAIIRRYIRKDREPVLEAT